MVIKMKNNNPVIIISITTLILIILIPTLLKVSYNHKQKIYDSEIAKIKEKATICILEKKCVNEKIYLKDLVEYGYIKKRIVNPLTNEYFNEDESYLIKKEVDFEVEFN